MTTPPVLTVQTEFLYIRGEKSAFKIGFIAHVVSVQTQLLKFVSLDTLSLNFSYFDFPELLTARYMAARKTGKSV